MEKKIRIGHIGTKHDHSLGKLQCVLKYPELFEVVGIVEEDPLQQEAVKNLPPYREIPFMTEEELFNKGIDCALVEGFEYDLPYIAARCLENGIAVHIDITNGLYVSLQSRSAGLPEKNTGGPIWNHPQRFCHNEHRT